MHDHIDALQNRQLTAEEAEMLADHVKPEWAERDRGARSVAPVAFVDGEIEIRRPRDLESFVRVHWSEEVIGTLSAEHDSPREVRDAFASFCDHQARKAADRGH